MATRQNGQSNNTTKFGDGAVMPDFFISFMQSLVNSNQDTDEKTDLNNNSVNDENAGSEKSQLPQIELIALPFGFFDNFVQNTSAQDSLNSNSEMNMDLLNSKGSKNISIEQDPKTDESFETENQANANNSQSVSSGTLELPPEIISNDKANQQSVSASNAPPIHAFAMDKKGKSNFALGETLPKEVNSDSNGIIKPLKNESGLIATTAQSDKPSHALNKAETQLISSKANSHNNHHSIDFNSALKFAESSKEIKPEIQNQGELIAAKINDVAQIMVDKAQSGEKVFFVRLDPPELGKIEIELKFGENNKIEAVLKAQTPEALNELMRQARDMVDMLNQAGFDLKKNDLNFSLNNFNNNNGNKNQSPKETKSENSLKLGEHQEIEIKQEIRTQKWNRSGISLVA